MGYTHYHYTAKKCNKKNWKELMGAVTKLFEDSGSIIQKECDDKDEPEVSEQRIRFNGIGNDGHETFMLERDGQVASYLDNKTKTSPCPCFNFCKTACKPYDEYVTATLLLAKIYLKDEIRLSSDGEISDWQEGVQLINDRMGWNIEVKNNLGAEYPTSIDTAIFIDNTKKAEAKKAIVVDDTPAPDDGLKLLDDIVSE